MQPFPAQHPEVESIDSTIIAIMNIEAPRHTLARYAFMDALPLRLT